MRWTILALAAACSLGAVGCSRAEDAKAPLPAGVVPVDEAFGEKVRSYLLQNPEVIREAIDQYNANQELAAATEAKVAIERNRAALERDARDYVANPDGKITLVQFYDYRCPYCVASAPQVSKLIADNPDLRVVFKELAILGPASERAARAALAVKRAGGDYIAAHDAFYAAKPLNDAVVNRVLAANGLPPSAADQPNPADAAHLADIRKLASEIGVNGTPSFIIGDTLIPGADMDALLAAVTAARKQAG